jgi:alpha-1,3-rhamnosyl/mannosyltransferase
VPVRIALDYRPALLSHAGIGRAVRELARALTGERDLEVHLFAHSFARPIRPIAAPPGSLLHRSRLPGRTLPLLARLGFGADRLAGGAQVFHWTDYVHPTVRSARVIATVHDLAFVHDKTWHGANTAVLQQRTEHAARAAAVVVTPSAATAADLRRVAPQARIEVIPFGCDHLTPATYPHPLRGEDYALCLGTIEPRKNHRALLAAWRKLPAPRPRLLIVGRRGWEDEAIVAELAEAVRDGTAQWWADAEDETVSALLAHARLLVYPSLWEGFGFPPLEAMARGVPVVAHDCAPLRELTEGAATLCDARSPDALAAAITRTLRDRTLVDKLVAAGRARAACFRWSDCARAHAALYREVAS